MFTAEQRVKEIGIRKILGAMVNSLSWNIEQTKSLQIKFMIKSYLKIALRNILRNKVYSALNILGLAASR